MSDRAYDQFGHRFVLPVSATTGIAIAGTATALGATALTQKPVPFACKLTSGSRINITGKTDAVALLTATICRSVGGTGTVFACGTFVMNGTNATGAPGSAASVSTGTAAEFAANDVVSLSMAIGTVATLNTSAYILGFEELYN